ncbi:MAG: rhodanese-like domain-containing protein [Pseudomonadota bacterium]
MSSAVSNTGAIPDEALWHDAFYRLGPVANPQALASHLRGWAEGLTGCLWVAPEGVNGVLAGSEPALAHFRQQLSQDTPWAPLFAGLNFKRSACRTPPFGRLKVMCCAELLPLSLPPSRNPLAGPGAGLALSPDAWRELLRQDDVVLLDNRNSFEFRLGRFRGAIDPQVENFRDFPAYVRERLPAWQAEGKRVAMYCTGGIRCDKTNAWLQNQGLEVFTLEGGILHYLAQTPDAHREWEGECFVFDNRIALDAQLQETGTTADAVYTAPQDAWRLARARRLGGKASG